MTPKQEAYIWIQNIIDSCNNDFHFGGADKLIELFDAIHKDDQLTTLLQLQRNEHWNTIHSILS